MVSDLRTQIAARLVSRWDPLPEGSPRRIEYVEMVYQLVTTGATSREIAEYLVSVETATLGYRDTEPSTLIPLANKLRKLARP